MDLLQFYIITLLFLLATAVWLWRQGRERSRFAHSLYLLMGWQVVGVGVSFLATVYPLGSWPFVGLQAVSWGCLLWGLELNWRGSFVILLLGIAAELLSVSEVQIMLSWGFIMSLPFAALADLRQRSSFPIFAATPMSKSLKPVATEGHITAEMVVSEQPILECLTDGVIICGPSGLIYSTNQATTVMLGVAENGLIGRPLTDMLAHFPILEESSQERKSRHFEVNGRTIASQMNIIYDQEGAAQGTVVILRDITTEYQAELSRDNFLTTVSHELRTPLTAIKGYVELLQTGSGGELTSSQRLFMETIQRNVTRMVDLINSLIFAASVKGGQMEFKSGPANLPQLIQQINREMTPTAAKTNQTIKMDIDSRLHWIDADPIHVAMIIEELLANGIKYGRDGGEVRITASLETEEFAVVSVTDDGIGIASEDQTHIFDDFFRPESREEQVRSGGLGMGLSVVRALVEAYNGRIWFESVPNQGATFTFILPTHQPHPPEALTMPQFINSLTN
ncbi:MAG: hypothetical protein GY796_01370 [Chloroflexi bacterium]|nr:hypothetical protein [Chloroflexota bacterium]